MRALIFAGVMFAAVAVSSSSAKAQAYTGTAIPSPTYSTGGTVYSTWYVTPSFGAAPVYHGGTYYPPYDYYAAYPMPARVYSSGFSNDFPFYGKPYGHPSTPWTWETLSTFPAPGGVSGPMPTPSYTYGYVLGH